MNLLFLIAILALFLSSLFTKEIIECPEGRTPDMMFKCSSEEKTVCGVYKNNIKPSCS